VVSKDDSRITSIRERSERFTAPELREGAAFFIDVFVRSGARSAPDE